MGFAMRLREVNIDSLAKSRDPLLFISPEIAAVGREVARTMESEPGKGDGWLNPAISWKALQSLAVRDYRKLGEANPSSAFGQLFRVGTQMRANSWYQRHPSTYQIIAYEEASANRMEFDAPLFGSELPREEGEGTPYQEGQVKGQDLEFINRKFGRIESFTRELFDDDQTSQINKRQKALGDSMKMWEDIYFSRRFIGVASTDYPQLIRASGWSGENASGTAITTPFSTTIYTSSAGNRPSSYVQLSQPAIVTAISALRQARDPLNVNMVVVPDYLMVSTIDEMAAKTLLKSAYYPATPGRTGETAANYAAGYMHATFAENVLKDSLELVVNVHLKAWVWAIGQKQTGYKFQRRDAMEIVQEVPNSGQSFESDTIRFRARSRWEQDWIDPRFHYLGNDGSVTGTV